MTLSGWPDLYLEIAPRSSPLDPSPTWWDVSSYANVVPEITTKRGRSAESSSAVAGTATFLIDDAEDRAFDPLNTSSKFHATYLTLTGASGSYASTPDTAALDITGDIDLRCRFSTTDLTPAAASTLIGKWTTPNFSYILALNTDGTLIGGTTADGTTLLLSTSTASLTTVVSDGDKVHVRATLDVNNGGGGRTWTFYYSTDNTNDHTAVTWTQLGSAVTVAATTSIHSGTAILEVGANTGGTASRLTGTVYYAAVLNGIGGTVVANPDFTIGWGAGTTSRADSTGKTWTVNSPASVAADTTVGSYIRHRMPCRFRAVYSATEYHLWRGHLTIDDQQYPPNDQRKATLTCTDLFAVAATAEVSDRSAWAATVERMNPRAWWRLGDDPAGHDATDETGRYDGFYTGSTPTSTTGIVDGDESPALSTGTNGFVVAPGGAWPSTGFGTVAGWFVCPPVTGADMVLISGGFGGPLLYVVGSGGDAGKVSFTGAFFSARVDDSQPHFFCSVATAPGSYILYIDGVAGAEGSGTSVTDFGGLWLGVKYDGSALFQNGTLDEFVTFDASLTADEVDDLYQAGLDSWAGETTGQRIERAAATAGIPTGLQDVDTGASTVAAWTGAGSALDVAQAANTTEQGLLFVSGDGKLTFIERAELLNLPVSATFDNVSGNYYSDHQHQRVESQLVNRARFTSPAGTATAKDQDSIDEFGFADGDRTTIDDNLDNLRLGAQYLVSRNSWPEHRTLSLEVDPTFDPTNQWPLVLGLDIGDRITVKRTFDVGSSINTDVIIVGVEHRVSDTTWRTRFHVTTADTSPYLTLDDATLGTLALSRSKGPLVGNRLAF